ncbi:RNA-directed DNA polymerase from mobile element jockey [Portunus trituberculatus]|uniref:RNA-directed DNA polymerase from mobile element jockey n=1 Tax=Portunus trituberculatus TaxID=210409 RepID=A0A5B7G9N2_PORTR|nr:RNA-directed DNA polymerase from mobile element jockey [Portunus trituberculatus]
MSVPDPDKTLPTLPQTIKNKLQQITSEAEVRSILTKLGENLHLLPTSELSGALNQVRATAVVALDIEGAFDRLHATGIDGALLPFLQDYLKDRHLQVTVGGRESEVQPIRAGIPQGRCFNPLLWNIYINDLLHLIPSIKSYADDLTLTHSHTPGETSTVAAQLNTNLRCIIA